MMMNGQARGVPFCGQTTALARVLKISAIACLTKVRKSLRRKKKNLKSCGERSEKTMPNFVFPLKSTCREHLFALPFFLFAEVHEAQDGRVCGAFEHHVGANQLRGGLIEHFLRIARQRFGPLHEKS